MSAANQDQTTVVSRLEKVNCRYSLAGEFHKEGDDDQSCKVHDGQFVKLLTNIGLPALEKHKVPTSYHGYSCITFPQVILGRCC